jgi:CRP/FNR family transcriptional regulator, cyclic AMP receptor protein
VSAPKTAEQGIAMLTTLEKVLILKSATLFADTPEHLLIEIAAVLVEEQLTAGQVLFHKGDSGSSMYLISYGSVRIYDGTHIISELGERAVFGEMALLDPEARVASAMALEDTLLLRIDHRPFLDLMADHGEIATGIIHILTRYLRDRVAVLSP